jgi:hypothetical protein
MGAAQLLQLALALLPTVTHGITEFIAWINSLKSTVQQAGEWTDAQEADFRAALFAKTNDPAYKPDVV